jgi:hypothetical protein
MFANDDLVRDGHARSGAECKSGDRTGGHQSSLAVKLFRDVFSGGLLQLPSEELSSRYGAIHAVAFLQGNLW